jgi:hypothetical protein
MAYWIYENRGTGDWYSSEKCWKKWLSIIYKYMKKDSTNCPSWQKFVNVYRAFYGNNEDLDKPYIRNMREKELQRAIINMQSLSTN